MSRKIVEYEVASGDTLDNEESTGLLVSVKALIAEGYQPLGGVTVVDTGAINGYAFYFYQAMVKYEEVDNGK